MKKLQFYRDPQLDCYEIKEGCGHIPAERPHCHKEVAIGVVESGRSIVSCQDQDFFVEAEHIVVFPPAVMHKCRPEDIKTWQFKMLYVQRDWLESVFGQPIPWAVVIKKLAVTDISAVKQGFAFLESEADAEDKETALMLLLNRIFALADIHISEASVPASEAAAALKAYIEDHYWQPISLDEMAQRINTTKFHLIRLFDRSYGMPPHAYLMQLRLSQAKEMLRDGVELSDIAISLGFYDQSHFSKAFKQYVGVTPLIYQRAD